MSTEHDLEYGPTPPGAGYEHTDIDPSIGYRFGVWLTVSMVISVFIVYGVFWLFDGRRVAHDAAVQQFPLAVGQAKEAPAPRLQTQPFKDVYMLNQDAGARLHSYGWADEANGIVHIPIERAMELTLQRGLPASADDTPRGQVVQDSSAGRTVSGR